MSRRVLELFPFKAPPTVTSHGISSAVRLTLSTLVASTHLLVENLPCFVATDMAAAAAHLLAILKRPLNHRLSARIPKSGLGKSLSVSSGNTQPNDMYLDDSKKHDSHYQVSNSSWHDRPRRPRRSYMRRALARTWGQ